MEADALASDRSTGRGMSRQNGMCEILFSLDCSLPLGDMWHCDKSGWKGNEINKCSCAFTKAIWDPCEIIWTGNWSTAGFGFFLRSALVHIHQGLELSQCSSRWDWGQLWSDTLHPLIHLTWLDLCGILGRGPWWVQWAGEEVWSEWDLGWRSWILHSSQHSLASPHLLFLRRRREGTMKSTEIWGDLFLGSYNQKYSCFKLNLKARFSYCSEQWIDISSRSILSCCSLRTWGIFSMWWLPSPVAQGPCFLHMYNSEVCLEVLLVWVVKKK